MINRSALLKLGFFLYLAGTTIGFATVNYESMTVILVFRRVMLIMCALILFVCSQNLAVKASTFCAVCLVIAIYLVDLANGLDNLNHIPYLYDLGVSFIVVIFGIMYISSAQDEDIQIAAAKYYIAFALAVVTFLMYTGGLTTEGVPHFNYDVFSSTSGSFISYSQGITKFFGLSAIACTWVAIKSRRIRVRLLLLPVLLTFSSLAFIGGAR